MERKLLTTAEAAKMLAVGTSTLKRWADEGIVESFRTAGGHRRFTIHAVDKLLIERQGNGDGQLGPLDAWVELLTTTTDPLLVTAELMRARSRLRAWWRVADEIGEVLVEVGERWEQGRLSVMQEHQISELLHRALAWCGQTLPSRPDAPVCLLVAAAGDDHTLGLSLAELTCLEAGWAARWAGRRTPGSELTASIQRREMQLVAVSASLASNDGPRLARYYQHLAGACRAAGVPLVLGGEGAWPEQVPRGQWLHDFESFHRLLLQFLADAEPRLARG
jgi:excisionase family DNA binding protein